MLEGQRDTVPFCCRYYCLRETPWSSGVGRVGVTNNEVGEEMSIHVTMYPSFKSTEELELFIVGSLRHNSSKGEPVVY